MDHAVNQDREVGGFYRGRHVLITGATGFVGKALVEKLLRSCPEVASVFLLVRTKHGVEPETRFRELLKNPVFDRIRSECPSQLSKLRAVVGDVGKPDLGLSPADRDLLRDQVSVVLHSAATVRFNEHLKLAVQINTVGTRRVVDLVKSMAKLVAFVHVSTAYSNADKPDIEERVYPPPADPEAIVRFVQTVPQDTLQQIENTLIGKHPNTYTYTKSLAETIVANEAAALPTAIVRPSIVTAAWQEPYPGWIDNVSGITGMCMEVGRGTVRTILCDSSMAVDIVPVDLVVNTVLAAAAQVHYNRPNCIPVYNCTSGGSNPIHWHELRRHVLRSAQASPSKYVQWYPGVTMRLNKFAHRAAQILLHFLPAFVLDLVLRAKGLKPIMVRIYERTRRSALTGEFFSTNEFNFECGAMRALAASLSTSDRAKFALDVCELNWAKYVNTYMLGIRQFVLKDDFSSLPAARSKLKMLQWCQRFMQAVAIAIILRSAVAIL